MEGATVWTAVCGDAGADRRDETTFGANWFFKEHRSKLTVDLSRLDVDEETGGHTNGAVARSGT